MGTINDRMELLVNQVYNGNKAAFAKAIDLPPTIMSSYLGNKRRSKPSVDMVAKIVQTLDVDARWLLTGEEPSEKEAHTAVANGDKSVAAINSNVNTSASSAEAVLSERVKSLEALLKEKERLIKVYEQMMEKR